MEPAISGRVFGQFSDFRLPAMTLTPFQYRPRIGRGKRSKEVKSNLTDNESAKMTSRKGTIQNYNGVATVDKKHQFVIDAEAFGKGQEHQAL